MGFNSAFKGLNCNECQLHKMVDALCVHCRPWITTIFFAQLQFLEAEALQVLDTMKCFEYFILFILSILIVANYIHQQVHMGGTQWRSWLRHRATSWKVVGSIPDGVIGIFHWHNPSSHNMALGLTQPLTEMSTRNISWGVKAAGA